MTRARVGKKKILFATDEDEALFYERNFDKEITIEVIKRRRTLSQNAYYWVYITIIAKETGNHPDDLHEYFKSRFLPDVIIAVRGKKHSHTFTRKKSTTELTKNEMSVYLEQICAETQVPLPNPEDAGYISNY